LLIYHNEMSSPITKKIKENSKLFSVAKKYLLENTELISAIPETGFSHGISYSDVWFLKLCNTSDQVCMKIHIDPSSLYSVDPNLYAKQCHNSESITEAFGLTYEIKMYAQIQELIDNKICSNFIGFYGTDNYSYDDLLQLAIINGISEYQLNRNIYCMRINKTDVNVEILDDRNDNECKCGVFKYRITYNHEDKGLRHHRIETNKKIIEPYLTNFKNYNYKTLFTETFDKTKMLSLYWFMVANKSEDEKLMTPINVAVLFQALIACYSLQIAKINHNDLMLGNLFVRTLDTPEQITYVVNGKVYTITTIHRVYLFDYNRSYSEKHGENITTVPIYAKEFSQFNELVPNKDAFQLLQGMHAQTNNSVERSMLKGWAGIWSTNEYWIKIISHPQSQITDVDTRLSVPANRFAEINSTEDIIANVGKHMGPRITDEITTKNLQVMHPSMYDKNGNINISAVNLERKKYS
jgi:hypothetical protein